MKDSDDSTGNGGIHPGLFLLGVVAGIFGPIIGLFVFAGPAAGVAGFMIVPTLFFLSEAHRVFHRARRIADIPTALVRSATQGYVELSGRLDTRGKDFPVSPVTDTPSHYWHVALLRRSVRGDSISGRWVPVREMASAQTFLPFRDDTGSAYVMINELYFNPGSDTCIAHTDRTRLKARTRADLEALRGRIPDALLTGDLGDGPWRVEERVLPADQPLFVTGLFRTVKSNRNPTLRAPWGGLLEGGDRTAWETEMRRLEGIKPKAHLTGSQRVDVVTIDTRTGLFQPVVLASRHDVETFLIRVNWREAAVALVGALAFTAIGAFGLAVALDPELLSTLRSGLYTLF